jgi:hypothetical protein
MPLNTTTWVSSIKACGFGGQGIVRITTGSQQVISVSPTRSSAITLADGVIITGSMINSSSGHDLYYKTISFASTIPSYSAQQSTYHGNLCGGGTINLPLSAGQIASGRQIPHAEDGTGSYTNDGTIYFKPFTLLNYATLTWGSQLESPTVQSGGVTTIPGTTVTDGSTVNICTGWRYDGGGGACGRLTYGNINHRCYYRSLTVS